jgi:hypothetical protein
MQVQIYCIFYQPFLSPNYCQLCITKFFKGRLYNKIPVIICRHYITSSLWLSFSGCSPAELGSICPTNKITKMEKQIYKFTEFVSYEKNLSLFLIIIHLLKTTLIKNFFKPYGSINLVSDLKLP